MPTHPHFADHKADLAAIWSQPSTSQSDVWPVITEVTDADVPDGFALWQVDDRLTVVMPRLRPSAPADLHLRYLAATIAVATGRCPICGGIAGLSQDYPTEGRIGLAAWEVLPLYVVVKHLEKCPAAGWSQSERVHFEPPVGTEEVD